jgi:imidazole glycerol phosphate synthase subunit HisF
MTEEQFEQAMDKYQLDMEYTDYIMERANVGNGEILIRLMERGDFYEGFKESMVTEFKPRREWIGLTEQEHIEIAIECGCMSADWIFYGATVERKLKEKNNL